MWEVFGWTGSVLVVLSLMIPSVRKFRVLNLIGSLIATIYNAYFGIWPYAVMNGSIVLINVYWLWRLSQEGETEEKGYSVVAASVDDPIVQRFISRNSADISKSYPTFTAEALDGTHVRLVMHDEEVVGLFALRPAINGVSNIVVDYVTERFRDFGPGAYVYSSKNLFDDVAADTLIFPANHTTDPHYFKKQGFIDSGENLVRKI